MQRRKKPRGPRQKHLRVRRPRLRYPASSTREQVVEKGAKGVHRRLLKPASQATSSRDKHAIATDDYRRRGSTSGRRLTRGPRASAPFRSPSIYYFPRRFAPRFSLPSCYFITTVCLGRYIVRAR